MINVFPILSPIRNRGTLERGRTRGVVRRLFSHAGEEIRRIAIDETRQTKFFHSIKWAHPYVFDGLLVLKDFAPK